MLNINRYITCNGRPALSQRVFCSLLIFGLLVTGLAAPTAAGGSSSARSVAMGGAYMSLASGVDAARYNPANLGLAEYQVRGVELIGIGVSVANNSLTLSEYNKYTGAFLTDADKADILNKIPSEGLTFSANVSASALSVSLGSLVFTTEAVGAAAINLNKDIINLILNGNSFGDTIDITGSYSEALAYASFGLSYGRPVYTSGTRLLAVGGTVKYLKGLAIEEMVEMTGTASTDTLGFSGQGSMIARTATGGSGFSLDIGATLKLNDNYTAGLSIKNFLSTMSWSGNPEEIGYRFNFDTVTIDNMNGDFVVSDDYTLAIESFKSSLPSVMTVGIANTSGKLLWAFDWEQGFRRSAGSSSKPRLSAGLEWSPVKAIPLRTGFSTGGNKTTAFSFGTGLNLSAYHLDLAVISGASLSPSSTRGLNVALSTGIRF